MTDEQYRILQQLYALEAEPLQAQRLDVWTTPGQLAAALPPDDPLHGDQVNVRAILESLWRARKVLQVPEEPARPSRTQPVEVDGHDAHGPGEQRLAQEEDDCRLPAGTAAPAWEEVALFAPGTK